MARRPNQGDDTDYFSGAEEELEIQRGRPKFDIDAYNREQAAMAQVDDRDRMEEALSKPRAQASKSAESKPAIVTKEQLKASGYSNLRDYLNAQRGLTRRGDKSTVDELANMDRSAKARQTAAPAAPKDRKGSEIIAEKQEKAAPKMAEAYRNASLSQGLKDVMKAFGFYKKNPSEMSFGDILKAAANKKTSEAGDRDTDSGMKKGGKVINESKMMKAEGRGMAKADMQKVASKAVKGHEKRMHGMKVGGSVSSASKRADGIAIRGKTKGRIV